MAKKSGYFGARQVNKAVRELSRHEEFTSPTLTTTGRQLLSRGITILSGERKGEIRGYKAYRAYVKETIMPHDKNYKPLTEKEYREIVEDFVSTFSSYTTDKAVTSPQNLFTVEGQREYYYQRAIYSLSQNPHISISEEEIRSMSKNDLDKAYRLANEIRDNLAYDSDRGEKLYYYVLERVIDDMRNGLIIEGQDYVTDNKGNVELTETGYFAYASDINTYI